MRLLGQVCAGAGWGRGVQVRLLGQVCRCWPGQVCAGAGWGRGVQVRLLGQVCAGAGWGRCVQMLAGAGVCRCWLAAAGLPVALGEAAGTWGRGVQVQAHGLRALDVAVSLSTVLCAARRS